MKVNGTAVKTFLQFIWWPNGNFHWLHLWFIPYLFFYNILSIPVYRFLQKNNSVVMSLECFLCKPVGLLVFIVLAIIPYTFLSVHYPTTHDFIHDYARHSFFIFFVLAGLIAFRFNSIMEAIELNRALFFRLAFLAIIIINVIRWNGLEPQSIWNDWMTRPQTYLYIALLNLNSWVWVFTFIGYGRKYLNKGSQFLTYCNCAVYPFYILHQTVIVVIGYYVVQTSDNAAFKYGFLLITCFMLCIITYHLYIRPFKIMRFLFGVK